MATDLSILDDDATNVVIPRRVPDGDFLVQAINVEFEENKNNKLYGNIELKVLQPLQDQDMTGVSPDATLYHKVFVTAKSKGMAKAELAKFGIDVNAPFKDLFERIIGQTAVATITKDEYYETKGKDYAKVVALRAA